MFKKLGRLIRTIILAPIITGAAYLLAIMPRIWGRPSMGSFTQKYFAHRGLYDNSSDAPENSLKAFKKAVDRGYGIELDVQLTKDKKVVVAHDFDLKRICGVDKKIADLTYKELKKYKIFDSDCTIPTFAQVLEVVNGKVPLIIEYKLPSFNTQVCEIVDEMLESYNGDYMIESFHPMAVYWYKKNRPNVFRGILSSDYKADGSAEGYSPIVMSMSKNLLFNFLIKPDFIAYDCRFYNNTSRNICMNLYKTTSVAWTIKSQKELEERRCDYDLFIFEGFIPN